MAEQPDVVGGTPIASTWGNLIRDRTVMPFTNRASRNADIPTATAGQVAHLANESGLTIYNGTAWVQVTPEGAYVSNQEQRSANSYGDLTTPGPSVTLETGSVALIQLACQMTPVAGAGHGFASIEVTGASAIAAADGNGVIGYLSGTGILLRAGANVHMSVTPGVNTFTVKYRADGTNAIWFALRSLTVVGAL